MKLFFDGGCRPNPGPIEVAVVARGQVFRRDCVEGGSNSDAEWLALLYALEVARELHARDVILIGDSIQVVNQAAGITKCRSPAMRGHRTAFAVAAEHFDRIRLRHVRRSHNLAGIALAAARSAF